MVQNVETATKESVAKVEGVDAIQSFQDRLLELHSSNGNSWPKGIVVFGYSPTLISAVADAIETRLLVLSDGSVSLSPGDRERFDLLCLEQRGLQGLLLTYTRFARWLMARGLRPQDVAVIRAPHPLSPVALEAENVIDDVRFGNSSKILALQPAEPLLAPEFILTWCHHLASQGDFFHALKLLHLLSGSNAEPDIAPLAQVLCTELGIDGPVLKYWQWAISKTASGKGLPREASLHTNEAHEARVQQLLRNLALFGYLPDSPETKLLQNALLTETGMACVRDTPFLLNFAKGLVRDTWPAFFRFRNERIEELGPLSPPIDLMRDAKIEFGRKLPGHPAVLVVGSQLQALLNLLHNHVERQDAPTLKHRIYWVASNPTEIAPILGYLDLNPLADRYGLRIFLGDDALKRCFESIKESSFEPVPTVGFGLDPSSRTQLETFVHDYREQRITLVTQNTNRYTKARTREALSALQGRLPRPARMLFLTTIHSDVVQYVCRDMAEGMREWGIEAHVVRESRFDQLLTIRTVPEEIAKFDPDIVVLVDHFRPEHQDALPAGLPVVCWIQDELAHLIDRRWISKLGSLDFTYALWPHWIPYFRGLGYPHLEQLSFAASTSIYNAGTPAAGAEKDRALYFITNWSPVPPNTGHPALTEALLRRMTPELAVDLRDEVHRAILDDALRELGVQLGDSHYRHVLLLVRDQLTRFYDRRHVARSLIATGMPVRLYGRGWDQVEEFKPYACGQVAQGEDLAALYRKAAIVVQVNHNGNAHSRVFEAIACGAAVLARKHPSDMGRWGLNEHLTIGEEVLTYFTQEELNAATRRLLTDDEYYRGIVRNAQARVLRDHDYRARSRQMLDDVIRTLQARLETR